jgi:predicted XRE-type DNA-binding protein
VLAVGRLCAMSLSPCTEVQRVNLFKIAKDIAQATFAVKFNELVDKRGLTQMESAAITGMTQSKVSQVRRYKLLNVSLDRPMQALVSLNQHVEIVVWLRDQRVEIVPPSGWKMH